MVGLVMFAGDAEFVDAAVIGAGPAGAIAALGLARRGRRVLLIEKQRFPRPKVCGCCLNANALATLDHAGLSGLTRKLGAVPLEHAELFAAGRRARLRLPAGVSLSRPALDGALVEAARDAGAGFRDGVSARVRSGDVGYTLRLGDGRTVAARVVVVADGLSGSSLTAVPGFGVQTRPASRVGFGGMAAETDHADGPAAGTIAMACGRAGYLGAVRLENGRLDFAAAIDADALKHLGGPAAAAREMLRQAGRDHDAWPLDRVTRWRATPAMTRRRPRLAGPGLFVVGDAAGYVEPFTGEGMAWALAGGHAVAGYADRAVAGDRADLAAAWTAEHRRRVRRRQAVCRVVAATLRRPRLTAGVVGVLSCFPRLASPVTSRLARPTPHGALPA
ncbi:MAG: FAD-dependent monooxygenase [Planctomycetota bacterium]